ncbi:MAG TPA: hypothetical protein VN442_03320 [Bryobacteraceae bacterium]|nr:hypothetical protein [Bryobacteraceae bacterium]
MLGFMAGDSETYWLSVTNIGLGIVVLICLMVVILGVLHELLHRRSERNKLSKELDRDLKNLVAEYEADDRIFRDPALGPTMADGGDEIAPPDSGRDRR